MFLPEPDSDIVPCFNGPTPFPADLTTTEKGRVSGSYGVVRSTSPLGTWTVSVRTSSRPGAAVIRTFEVIA